MTTALIYANGLKATLPLRADLEAAGIQVLGIATERGKLLQDVVRHAPEVVICDVPTPDDALFKDTIAIAQAAPRPIMVFTADADVAHIDRAIACGIHAYVVNGYGANRLRGLIHLAQARFRQVQAHALTLTDISTRFEERKLVERAKGILMQAQHLSDDDAYSILRTTSMQSNQRLGQVSQHIVQSSRFAEDVNRCGQLRMLSQRLVTLHVLQQALAQAGRWGQPLQESVQRIDANLVYLAKSLSQATYGDLLGRVQQTWAQLQQALQTSPAPTTAASDYARIDELAESLLQDAERLTAQLESAGLAPPLRVLNLAGRQRMLSQRFAKFAILKMLGEGTFLVRNDDGMDASRAAFEEVLTYLNSLPLSAPAIHAALGATGIGWLTVLAATKAAPSAGTPARTQSLHSLAQASESLLAVLEQLSAHYEHSMQMLTGA